jgi:hypothetical protein
MARMLSRLIGEQIALKVHLHAGGTERDLWSLLEDCCSLFEEAAPQELDESPLG